MLEYEAAAEEAAAGVTASGSIRITYPRRREGSCGWWLVGRLLRCREIEWWVRTLFFYVSNKSHYSNALSGITYVARVETGVECYQ